MLASKGPVLPSLTPDRHLACRGGRVAPLCHPSPCPENCRESGADLPCGLGRKPFRPLWHQVNDARVSPPRRKMGVSLGAGPVHFPFMDGCGLCVLGGSCLGDTNKEAPAVLPEARASPALSRHPGRGHCLTGHHSLAPTMNHDSHGGSCSLDSFK